MSMDLRYHVIPDQVGQGVLIYDAETGSVQHPACWQDIAAYYFYLVDRGRMAESQNLLAESMAGHKPITNMVVTMSKSSSGNNSAP
jgi:hypothetical protein